MKKDRQLYIALLCLLFLVAYTTCQGAPLPGTAHPAMGAARHATPVAPAHRRVMLVATLCPRSLKGRTSALSHGFRAGMSALATSTPKQPLAHPQTVAAARENLGKEAQRSWNTVQHSVSGQVKHLQKQVNDTKIIARCAKQYDEVVNHTIPTQVARLHKAGQVAQEFVKTSQRVCSIVTKSYSDVKDACKQFNGVVNQPVEVVKPNATTPTQVTWENEQGDIIIPLDNHFNPNIGSTHRWHKVAAVKPAPDNQALVHE